MQIIQGGWFVNLTKEMSFLPTLVSDEVIIIDNWLGPTFDLLPMVVKKQSTKFFSDTYFDVKDYRYNNQFCYTGAFFYRQLAEYIKYMQCFQTNFETKKPFAFALSKNRWSRTLAVKIIEWFQLQNYNYTSNCYNTYIGNDILASLSQTSKVLKNNMIEFMAQPVKLENKKVYKEFTELDIQSNASMKDRAPKNFIANLETLFNETAVHLVAETVGFVKPEITIFTEKSIHPICALNIPIWLGGWNMVKTWRNLGFDTFDDVIDNSYDECLNYFDRCFYAVEKNYRLLTDLDYASGIRNQLKDRLISNRNHLFKLYDIQIDKIKLYNCSDEVKNFFLRFIYAA